MRIRVLGAHNRESQDSKFVSLLIDDCLAMDAGGLASSLSFAAQLKLKAILLTHYHYDHIRDIPAVAMNFYLRQAAVNLYALQSVGDALSAHLLNGKLYPRFLERPEGNPTVRFIPMEPYQARQIDGYSVLCVPVKHSEPAVGCQVTSPDGKAVFYTGDTGPGLADCWERISPRLLVIEVTTPDRYEAFATESRHLTPALLKRELTSFREIKGYLPQVIAVHMNPELEEEIKAEIYNVAAELNAPVNLAHEGMELSL
ncbi:MAG: MBL fold metallo-hydrolase [Chloroflexi bacterium]|nr:MBL fold metallo-hydrolase [Chloroflexota bacterium]